MCDECGCSPCGCGAKVVEEACEKCGKPPEECECEKEE